MRRTATSVSSVWAAPLFARVLMVSNGKMLFLFSNKNFATCLLKAGKKIFVFFIDTGTVIVYPLQVEENIFRFGLRKT
jgi:hypothetical protein